jgi:hypothetical protein
MRFRQARRCSIGLALLLILAAPSMAADDETEEDGLALGSGLVATYQTGSQSISQIEPSIALAWGDTPPDARLAPGTLF